MLSKRHGRFKERRESPEKSVYAQPYTHLSFHIPTLSWSEHCLSNAERTLTRPKIKPRAKKRTPDSCLISQDKRGCLTDSGHDWWMTEAIHRRWSRISSARFIRRSFFLPASEPHLSLFFLLIDAWVGVALHSGSASACPT